MTNIIKKNKIKKVSNLKLKLIKQKGGNNINKFFDIIYDYYNNKLINKKDIPSNSNFNDLYEKFLLIEESLTNNISVDSSMKNKLVKSQISQDNSYTSNFDEYTSNNPYSNESFENYSENNIINDILNDRFLKILFLKKDNKIIIVIKTNHNEINYNNKILNISENNNVSVMSSDNNYDNWACIIDNKIYKINYLENFLRNLFKQKYVSTGFIKNTQEFDFNITNNYPFNLPRIIYKDIEDENKIQLYKILFQQDPISHILTTVNFDHLINDIEKYLFFYESITKNLSYDNDKIISINKNKEITRNELLSNYRTRIESENILIDNLNNYAFFNEVKNNGKDYKNYIKKLYLEVDNIENLENIIKDSLFIEQEYILIKFNGNNLINDQKININNNSYNLSKKIIINDTYFLIFQKNNNLKGGFLNKNKFSCLSNRNSRLNYTNDLNHTSINQRNNNKNIMIGGKDVVEQKCETFYDLYNELSIFSYDLINVPNYNKEYLEKVEASDLEIYEENFNEDGKEINKMKNIFNEEEQENSWLNFSALTGFGKKSNEKKNTLWTKMKSGFGKFYRLITMSSKKEALKSVDHSNLKKTKNIWHNSYKNIKYIKNPKEKAQKTEVALKSFSKEMKKHNIEKKREIQRVLNKQLRHLKKMSNFSLKEKSNNRINQERSVAQQLSDLNIVPEFTKSIYKLLNDLYDKKYEKKKINGFKIYIEKQGKNYFNPVLFNLIINGRLNKSRNTMNLKSILIDFKMNTQNNQINKDNQHKQLNNDRKNNKHIEEKPNKNQLNYNKYMPQETEDRMIYKNVDKGKDNILHCRASSPYLCGKNTKTTKSLGPSCRKKEHDCNYSEIPSSKQNKTYQNNVELYRPFLIKNTKEIPFSIKNKKSNKNNEIKKNIKNLNENQKKIRISLQKFIDKYNSLLDVENVIVGKNNNTNNKINSTIRKMDKSFLKIFQANYDNIIKNNLQENIIDKNKLEKYKVAVDEILKINQTVIEI